MSTNRRGLGSFDDSGGANYPLTGARWGSAKHRYRCIFTNRKNIDTDAFSQTGQNFDTDAFSQSRQNFDTDAFSQSRQNFDTDAFSQSGQNFDTDAFSQSGQNFDTDAFSQSGQNFDTDAFSQSGQNFDTDAFSPKSGNLKINKFRYRRQNSIPKQITDMSSDALQSLAKKLSVPTFERSQSARSSQRPSLSV